MYAKIYTSLLVMALLGLLAGCGPAAPVDAVTPTSPQMEASPSPPPATAEAQSSPASPGFDCQNVQEISVEECQGLVALYENTNGETWQDNSGWLADDTPCDWIGVNCQQGHVNELQLANNELAGSLPPELGNLTYLKYLYLEDNQLNGSVPAEIRNFTELQTLRLGGNQFSSIPPELFNLSQLIELDLSRNEISGDLPGDLGKLSKLGYLTLHRNQFTGEIPPELGSLTNLVNLNLANNRLGGSIPSSLGDLASLSLLDLSNNQLTGSIPAELGNLTGLYLVDLSYNQLTGEVPQSLEDGPVADVRLWGNQLDGTIFSSEQAVTPVDLQGVHFEYSSNLAESVWPEIVAAEEGTPDAPGWLVWPEHLRFTFAGAREPTDSPIGSMGPFVHSQIMVFPVETYASMSDFAKEEMEKLQALLQTRPPAPEDPISLLPLINASQVFHAQVKYLDFQNGSGVRFLTQYSQDIFPIVNPNIFYTFQGLTQDGAYYVVAAFAIDSAGLPEEPDISDWEAFSAGYGDYLVEITQQLDALSSDQFEPDLALLDRVIQSLMVSVP